MGEEPGAAAPAPARRRRDGLPLNLVSACPDPGTEVGINPGRGPIRTRVGVEPSVRLGPTPANPTREEAPPTARIDCGLLNISFPISQKPKA